MEQEVYYKWVKASVELPESFTEIYMTRYPLVIYECNFLTRAKIESEKNAAFDIEWAKPFTIPEQVTNEEDKVDWKYKVEFYREQTKKLRQYIHDNKNIGNHTQGFFDAIYEHLIEQEDKLDKAILKCDEMINEIDKSMEMIYSHKVVATKAFTAMKEYLESLKQ